jgi:hypothetical protein
MTARQLARSSIERAKPAKLFYNVRRSDQRQRSKTAGGWLPLALLGLGRFSKNGAGRTGFEPVTSSVSECRSDAFGQLDRACDLPSYSVVPPAGPQRFPCIYPAYPGRPKATVGPTSAWFSNTRSSRCMGRVRGGSLSTISPPSRLGAPTQKSCDLVRSQEHGCWPRMAACPDRQPGVLPLRRLGPRRGGEVAMARCWSSDRWFGSHR